MARKSLSAIFLLLWVGFISYSQQRTEMSLPEMIDSLKTELKLADNDSLRAYLLMRVGENYQNYNPDSAILFGAKSLELAEKIASIEIQIGNLGFQAGAYLKKGNLPKSLELSIKALELADDLPDSISGGGPARHHLAQIHLALGEYDKALEVYNDILDIGEIVGRSFAYLELANLYTDLGKLDSALVFINLSYESFQSIKTTEWDHNHVVDPGLFLVKSKVHLRRDELDLAFAALFKTLEMTLENNETVYISWAFNDLALLHKLNNQIDSAIYYSEKGLAKAQEINYSQEMLRASQMLAELYEFQDIELALHYYKLATASKDRLYGSGNIQVMKDMIVQNEMREQELVNAELSYQNRLRTNILLGSTFTLVVVALLLYRNSRNKQKAKQKIETAYELLKSTQNQLIHSEKMASLGELTAGIAHEIQNPLNFVNNFSEVNKELLEELKEAQYKDDQEAVEAITRDLLENEDKIMHHGKRAEAIVTSMLQHSRTSTGKKEPTDINSLADEYLRLAYHGFRAKDKSFNAKYKTELAKELPKIDVVPQDIGRVLLNLINNAFQAVRQVDKPEVVVATSQGAKGIEIAVKDNGPGIPDDIKEKIFQPFFTTKPAGEGTGLGLSLSYDIVTKGHGGKLRVESQKGKGSEFVVELPVKIPEP